MTTKIEDNSSKAGVFAIHHALCTMYVLIYWNNIVILNKELIFRPFDGNTTEIEIKIEFKLIVAHATREGESDEMRSIGWENIHYLNNEMGSYIHCIAHHTYSELILCFVPLFFIGNDVYNKMCGVHR